MIDGIQQESRNNVEGQLNLFGEPDFEEAGAISIKIPEVEEYTRAELLAMEKETAGLYLSGHPMDEYRAAVRRAGIVPIGAILTDSASESEKKAYPDGSVVTVGRRRSVKPHAHDEVEHAHELHQPRGRHRARWS